MDWKRLLKTQFLAGLVLLLAAGESQAQYRRGGLFRRNVEPTYSYYQPTMVGQPTTTTVTQTQVQTQSQPATVVSAPTVTTQNGNTVLQPVTTYRGRFGRRAVTNYVEVPVVQAGTTTQSNTNTTATTTDPRRSFYPPAEADRAAVIDLRLSSPTAQVFFDDRATTQQGTVRQYVTPPLEADKEYTYQVRIRWSPNGANGQPLEETRQVQVKAGGRVQLELMQPSGQAEAAPAPRPAVETPQP